MRLPASQPPQTHRASRALISAPHRYDEVSTVIAPVCAGAGAPPGRVNPGGMATIWAVSPRGTPLNGFGAKIGRAMIGLVFESARNRSDRGPRKKYRASS